MNALESVVVPRTDDPDTAGFWDAARRGELVVRMCRPHGHVLHLPREYCHRCGSWDVEWRAVRGRGRVHSWTTVEHSIDPSFPPPYTVVLVELDDPRGVRFVGSIPGRAAVRVGTPMKVTFAELPGGVVLPQWVVADEADQ